MFRFFTRILALVSLVLCILPANASQSVRYEKVKVAGIWLKIVTVDLNCADVNLTPAVAKRGIGHAESFRSLLRRTRPAAAIDGTFFCTKTLKPTGDIIIDGRTIWKGYLGTALTVDSAGNVRMIPTRSNDQYKPAEYQNVLAAGPALILGGKTIVTPGAEGFRSSVHTTQKIRSAIGITYHNKLILAVSCKQVHLRRLAWALKALKCKDAACLDGGSSSGLYCKGKLIANPKRSMTNCLLVYDNPSQYARVHSSLSPLPLAGEQRADAWLGR